MGCSNSKGVTWYCGNKAQNEENAKGTGLFYSWRILPSRIFKDFFETQEWGQLANHPMRLIAYKPNTNKRIVLPIAECQSRQDAKAAIMMLYRLFVDNPKYSKIKDNHRQQYYELKRLLKSNNTWPPQISCRDAYNIPIFGDLNTLRMPFDYNIEHFEYDLIYIHGISGHMTNTWQSNDRDNTTFWPINFLMSMKDDESLGGTLGKIFDENGNQHKLGIPSLSQMRILTVGHNFCVAKTNSTEEDSFDDGSERIIAALNDAKVGTKPIIWLVHSLGGLVVKNILFKIKNDEKYRSNNELKNTLSIYDNTKGIIFYGTPHKGSCLAGAASSNINLLNGQNNNLILQRLFNGLRFDSVGMKFMDPITNRQKLDDLNNFLVNDTNIPFFNFIETKSVRNHVLVVNKESALLVSRKKNNKSKSKDDKHEKEEKNECHLLVAQDHISICKFENTKDGSYIKTKEILSKWIFECEYEKYLQIGKKSVKNENKNSKKTEKEQDFDKNWSKFVEMSAQQLKNNLFIIARYLEREEYYGKHVNEIPKNGQLVRPKSGSTTVALGTAAGIATVEAGGSLLTLTPSAMTISAATIGLGTLLMPMVAVGMIGVLLASGSNSTRRVSIADVLASITRSILSAMNPRDAIKFAPKLKSSIEMMNEIGIAQTMDAEYYNKYKNMMKNSNIHVESKENESIDGSNELIMFKKETIEEMTAMCLMKEFEKRNEKCGIGITSHNENKKSFAKYLHAANLVKMKLNWNDSKDIAIMEKEVISMVDKMVKRDISLRTISEPDQRKNDAN